MRFRKSRETTCACGATDGPQTSCAEPVSTSWKDTTEESEPVLRVRFQANLTKLQAKSAWRMIEDYERMNLIARSKDKSPEGFDDDGGKIWHVWCEGYAATGERGTASFVGKKWATTFDRACFLLHKERGGNRMCGEFTPSHDGRPPMYWGCRLFDNEADARRSYG